MSKIIRNVFVVGILGFGGYYLYKRYQQQQVQYISGGGGGGGQEVVYYPVGGEGNGQPTYVISPPGSQDQSGIISFLSDFFKKEETPNNDTGFTAVPESEQKKGFFDFLKTPTFQILGTATTIGYALNPLTTPISLITGRLTSFEGKKATKKLTEEQQQAQSTLLEAASTGGMSQMKGYTPSGGSGIKKKIAKTQQEAQRDLYNKIFGVNPFSHLFGGGGGGGR